MSFATGVNTSCPVCFFTVSIVFLIVSSGDTSETTELADPTNVPLPDSEDEVKQTTNIADVSDSESENKYLLNHNQNWQTMAPRVACVDQLALNKIPIMMTGDLTPENVQKFEIRCQMYFKHKDIDEENQIVKVAWGIQDLWVQTQYMENWAQINAMTFDDYIEELCHVWLPSNWEVTLCLTVLGTQQGEKACHDWAMEIQGANALLIGTTSYLTEQTLHNQLEAGHSHNLSKACQNEAIDTIGDFNAWLEEVRHIDDRHREELAAQQKLIYEAIQKDRNKRCEQQSNTQSSGEQHLLTNTTNT